MDGEVAAEGAEEGGETSRTQGKPKDAERETQQERKTMKSAWLAPMRSDQ
jgi:hypothetical protein